MYYLFVLLAFCVYFSFSDVSQRKLRNKGLLVFFVTQVLFLYIYHHVFLYSFFLVLICGFFLFYLKVISAGDVKLASIFSMALAPQDLLMALTITAFVGGLQALYYIIKHFLILKSYGESDVKSKGIPYGVAICIGFFITTFSLLL